MVVSGDMFCEVCGLVDEGYDEGELIMHLATSKHLSNTILAQYKIDKERYSRNHDDITIMGGVELVDGNGKDETQMIDHHKIRIYVKPKEEVNFVFDMHNKWTKEDILIVGIQLAHPQPQFVICDHPYIFGEEPHIWDKKTSLARKISVHFIGGDIGQYEMPIMFTFHRKSDKKNLIYIREMVVMVEENPMIHAFSKSPYTNEDLTRAERCVPSTASSYPQMFRVPHHLKILLPRGLEEKALEGIRQPEKLDKLRSQLIQIRTIFDCGITKENYVKYFQHLLWWEEIITKINLRKYNMTGVMLEMLKDGLLALEVPGLAEKRPSLLRGDRVYLQPQINKSIIFECIIKDIDDNYVHLSDVDISFFHYFTTFALFDVRFIMSRVPVERCHEAVTRAFTSKQGMRLFPEPRSGKSHHKDKTITKFYNSKISTNEEQRTAVEHIVSGSSGMAPYIVYGPPGTGKTMTIVEAIIQLVVRNPRNRVLVCTDSNMAADHIALMLLKFNKQLNINKFILRANSRSREWSVMPSELADISNGTSFKNFKAINNAYVSSFRIVVTTLLHAAKYSMTRNQNEYLLQMSHLFIDEAAQASEPHTLVPITGLLAQNGQLVLAGDPQQLGPVCISKAAASRGLGTSLLQRLRLHYENLYKDNTDYITMLVKNFRSDPDILKIPNDLFYDNALVALAPPDPISKTSILGLSGGERAIVFHAVHSREQRMGKAPSYFNEKELDMLKRYVKSLIDNHKVLPQDIGIIAPYIRQVYKMKAWLVSENYNKLEVGTVEAFQGKEKRVILVSTVRANCRLLDHDAKYGLGFLVDDKRFNVAITRAKAKVVVIGNAACLTRDIKWRLYMDQCRDYSSYHGLEDQQLERTSDLLSEIAVTRFGKCKLYDLLLKRIEERNKKNKKNGNL